MQLSYYWSSGPTPCVSSGVSHCTEFIDWLYQWYTVTHSGGKSNMNNKMFVNIQGEKSGFGLCRWFFKPYGLVLSATPSQNGTEFWRQIQSTLSQCLPAKKAPCKSTAVSSSAGCTFYSSEHLVCHWAPEAGNKGEKSWRWVDFILWTARARSFRLLALRR